MARKKTPHEIQWRNRGCECDVDSACLFMRERDEARAEIRTLKDRMRRHEEMNARDLAKAHHRSEELRQEYVRIKRLKRMMVSLMGPDRRRMFRLYAHGTSSMASVEIPRESVRSFAEALGQDHEFDWATFRRKPKEK